MMAMRLGTLAHTVGRLPLRELTAKLQGRGIDFVQLALSKAISDIDTSTGKLNSGLANHIAEHFDRVGIRIDVLGCYINPIHPDRDLRRLEIEKFKEHLRYARDFGAAIVATETANLDTYITQDSKHYERIGWKTLRGTLEELAEEAERWGVTVGLEPVINHTLSSTEKMNRILEEIPSSALGVVFDPVNLLTARDMDHQDLFLDDAFQSFGNRIVLAHLKDAAVVSGRLETMRTGTGTFATQLFISKLQEYKPYLDTSLELLDDENLDATFALVRGLLEHS
jgi:sugar phosphate isomerase/epimerase